MYPSPMRYHRRAVVEEELHNNVHFFALFYHTNNVADPYCLFHSSQHFDEMDTSSSYSRQSTPELSSDSDEDQSSRENSLFSSYDPPTPTLSGNELDSAFNNIRVVDDINYTLRTVLYEPPCRLGRGDSISTLNQSLYHFRPVVWEEEDDLTMADDDDLE